MKLDPKNARKNDKGVPKLMGLLKQYGQRSPITVDIETGIIYKGNTTWKAMKKLGFTEIAITPQSFEDQTEKTGYSLSDNKASEWTEWDEGMVVQLMAEDFQGVENSEISALTGFTEKEVLSFSYSEEAPDKLEDVDVSGITDGKVDYMVLQFPNRAKMLEFKKMLDPDGKHPRVVPSENLFNFIWKKIKEGAGIKELDKSAKAGSKAGTKLKKKFKVKSKNLKSLPINRTTDEIDDLPF